MTAIRFTVLRDPSPFRAPDERDTLGQIIAQDRATAYQIAERLHGSGIVVVRASSWPAPAQGSLDLPPRPRIVFAERPTLKTEDTPPAP